MRLLPKNPSYLRRLVVASLLVNLLLGTVIAAVVWRVGGTAKTLALLGLRKDGAGGDWREHRKQRFWDYPRSPADVVFLGDSLTADAPFVEFFGHVKNRGIGGDTTADLLRRLDETVRERPAAVFLLAGINDVITGVAPETTADNYRKIIRFIRQSSPTTRIHVESVLPVTPGKYDGPNLNPKVAALNPLLEQVASSEGVAWIDLRPAMTDAAGALRAEFTIDDGLHLSIDGRKAMLQALRPYVTPAPPSTQSR